LEALAREGIEFEIVPGITGAIAASCLSGIPLTDRRFASSCIFATGHEDPAKKKSLIDWKNITKNGTVVLYMSVKNLNNAIEKILNSGKDRDTPVAIVQDASLLSQRVLTGTLENIVARAEKEKLRPPAMVIIGKVAKLEREFNWLKRNKRILFTGLSKERFFEKCVYFHLPLIKIEPLRDYREFDGYLRKIREFDWIVFASRYGVEYFFKRFQALGYDARILGNIKVAAIGNSTRNRLLDFGIAADLVPRKESSEGLLARFQKENLKGKRIFLPRSDISDKGLEKGLKRFGAEVSASFAYRNVMPDDLPDLDLKSFDEIMFTSPSIVRNFKKRYKNLPEHIKVRCIGEVTLREAKKWKFVD
jgi:uroporphyrinogen III methyltransferase/synthase